MESPTSKIPLLLASLFVLAYPLFCADPVPDGGASSEDSPAWLKLGAEFRSRLQSTRSLGFQPGENETYWGTRLRLDLGIEANRWLRFQIQAQDAHAPGLGGNVDSCGNMLDFRQALVEFGKAEGDGWMFRLGRQELSYGDQRLVASDDYWDPLGPTYDAARLAWSRPGVRLEGFAALAVETRYRRFDRPATDNRLYGIYTTLNPGLMNIAVEPFLFRKSSGGIAVNTYGVRSAGDFLPDTNYNVEMAIQRGRRSGQPIEAWAGHWEVGRRWQRDARENRASLAYDFGSGDKDPADGHHGAFDDLYPAAYNGFGFEDPFPWINIRTLTGGVDFGLTNAWRVNLGYKALWLASLDDGLYLDPETWLVRNPGASSSHVGNQVFVQFGFQASQHWQLWLAIARLTPGAYLRESSFHGPLTTPYVTWSYRF